MHRHPIILAAAMCLATAPAWGQRPAEIRGAAHATCGDFSKARGTAGEGLYTQWLMGYLSGYNNFAAHAEVDIPDSAKILRYGDKFCRDNPHLHVRDMAVGLIADLGGYKTPTPGK